MTKQEIKHICDICGREVKENDIYYIGRGMDMVGICKICLKIEEEEVERWIG